MCASILAAVRDNRWYWGLGDPDVGAVLITAIYFLTGLICLHVVRNLRCDERVRSASKEVHRRSLEYSTSGDSRTGIPVSRIGNVAPPLATFALRKQSQFWLVLAVLLFLLGVNKQADLQSLLTLYGRDILRQGGLYDARRTIQLVFIVGVAAFAFFSVALCLLLVRQFSWPCRLAAIGLAMQAAFVVIRAASFHHVDTFIGRHVGQLKINLLLESIGLTVMLLAATREWILRVRSQTIV
ncbi:MAG: hypothetical protein O2856_06990 [Planctomycetota bacterium]|nr:hypothetical protein [Planctomycetota bacterium]